MSTQRQFSATVALRIVKVVHAIVWAIFAGGIAVLPVVALRKNLGASIILIAIVSLEVLVLLTNRLRCPLNDIAARCTQVRTDRR